MFRYGHPNVRQTDYSLIPLSLIHTVCMSKLNRRLSPASFVCRVRPAFDLEFHFCHSRQGVVQRPCSYQGDEPLSSSQKPFKRHLLLALRSSLSLRHLRCQAVTMGKRHNISNSRLRRHEDKNETKTNREDSYEALIRKYSRPVPRRSLLVCCSESLPVVQELSLSVFFLARYQLSVQWEEQSNRHPVERQRIERRLDWAHACILAGFLLVIAFRFQKQETLMKNTRTKARHRLTDACLLGILLRFLASVLRRLTASYSSDTVEALTMACMALHLLTCDYTYSSRHGENVASLANNQYFNDKSRPPFQGGTVSLNASFFATVLCISRLESDLTSYFFCSLAVIFFGFYPQTRADLLLAYPPHQSGT